MKNIILTFLFLLPTCFVTAQVAFIKEVDYIFRTTKITSDGGWIIAVGSLIQKYNSCGDLELLQKLST